MTADIWQVTYDNWHLTSNILLLTSDIWHLASDIWHLSSHISYLTFDMWYMTYNMWNMICDMWHVNFDMWHVTRYTWHMTSDMWHMTCDTCWGVNILSKFQLSSSNGLGVMLLWIYFNKPSLTLMNHEAVCRTAPATLGLLITIEFCCSFTLWTHCFKLIFRNDFIVITRL